MPNLKRVIEYRKGLQILEGDHYGKIQIKLQGARRMKTLPPMKLDEFLCLSHMLETDTVFYDTETKMFKSSTDKVPPTNLDAIV